MVHKTVGLRRALEETRHFGIANYKQHTNSTDVFLKRFIEMVFRYKSSFDTFRLWWNQSTFSLLVNIIYSFDSSDLFSLIHHKAGDHVAYHGKQDMTLWLIENSDIFQSMHHNRGRRRNIAVFPSLKKKKKTLQQ